MVGVMSEKVKSEGNWWLNGLGKHVLQPGKVAQHCSEAVDVQL